jgi:hypothetical protein
MEKGVLATIVNSGALAQGALCSEAEALAKPGPR